MIISNLKKQLAGTDFKSKYLIISILHLKQPLENKYFRCKNVS